MDLKDEVKDIIDNRPTSEERREYKTHAKEKRKKHASDEKRRAFPRRKGYIIALLVMAVATIAFLAMLIVANLLPPDLTVLLAVIVVVLLLLTNFMFASRYRWKRIIGILIALITVVVMVTVTSYLNSTIKTFNRIAGGGLEASGPPAKNVNVTEETFNIYLTGIDQWASEKGMDLERSDVNMIITVNPQTKKVLLTSIPRDSYVKLHSTGEMDKLTHTGIYGVEETIGTVEDWFGIDINYFVKMNFTGAMTIITAMNGIDVYSPVEFDSSIKGYHYNQGWNHLYGKEALYFARERKAFEGQDEIRVENQQRVLEAIIKKMTSSTTLLIYYGEIMDAAGDNIMTNMSAEDMKDLVRMQITDMASWDFEKQKVEGEPDEDYVASLSSSQMYSIIRTDEDSVRKCVEAIKKLAETEEVDTRESIKENSRSFFVNLVRHMGERITQIKEKQEEGESESE